mgnify:CR=1 FL=1
MFVLEWIKYGNKHKLDHSIQAKIIFDWLFGPFEIFPVLDTN